MKLDATIIHTIRISEILIKYPPDVHIHHFRFGNLHYIASKPLYETFMLRRYLSYRRAENEI